jgi:hypothetical protein
MVPAGAIEIVVRGGNPTEHARRLAGTAVLSDRQEAVSVTAAIEEFGSAIASEACGASFLRF